jgi:hypothetical protein
MSTTDVDTTVTKPFRPQPWFRSLRAAAMKTKWAKIKNRWWWVVGLVACLTVVLAVLAQSHANCQYLYQIQVDFFAQHPDQPGLPAEPLSPPVMTLLIGIVARLVSTVATCGFWTGTVYLGCLFLSEASANLGSAIRTAVWSWMPYAVRGVIQSAYLWITEHPIYNPGLSGLAVDNTPPPIGGGQHYVSPTQGELVMASILTHVDIYLFWQLALIASGLRALGLSRKKSILITVGAWVLLTLIRLIPVFFQNTFARFRFF